MLRFRLGPIPVTVHFSHLVISALIAWSSAQAAEHSSHWPGPELRDESQRAFAFAALIFGWMLLISVSVLIHELGHAVTSRLFGYQPAIQLVGMGGLTTPNAQGEIPWWKNVLLTLAGPGAGLLLALAAGGVLLALQLGGGGPPPVLGYFLEAVFYANLFWAGLNLVPVPPLDGGQIATALLVRALGRQGFLVSQVVSIVFAAGVILASYFAGFQVLAILFLFYGFRAVTLLMAYLRGDAPGGPAAHPLSAPVEQAERAFQQGDLARAAELAQSVAAQDPPPLLRSRAHHVLGWVALKSGEGRGALDHFAQVQALEVAPHALAAAFSLVGDELRALPLWEQAAAKYKDPVILHEYAGALIRAGRQAELRRLPGVRPALAWAAAERVYFLRGEFVQAAQAAEAAFREEPGATVAYDAACAWARAGDPASALRALALASQNGFSDRSHALSDPDLQSLRELPAFREWLDALKPSSLPLTEA